MDKIVKTKQGQLNIGEYPDPPSPQDVIQLLCMVKYQGADKETKKL